MTQVVEGPWDGTLVQPKKKKKNHIGQNYFSQNKSNQK
jgi:hypothetical protein